MKNTSAAIFRQVLTLIDRAVMDGGSSAALETAVA